MNEESKRYWESRKQELEPALRKQFEERIASAPPDTDPEIILDELLWSQRINAIGHIELTTLRI